MPDARSAVEAHYSRSDLGEEILSALRQAGKDPDHLTVDDLAPVDEFHTRQRAATVDLARLLDLTGAERVLDVGCGLGGPSRFLAKEYGCRVTGLDLTAEFCRVAEMLARRTGLAARVTYHHGDALALPFDAGAFDVVWSQNVAMNVQDRDRLYGEMRRVLGPRGRLAIQDVVAGPGGPPHFPVPWARDASISFLLAADATRARLEAAGFRVVAWRDNTEEARARAAARGRTPEPSALGLHLVLGADFGAMIQNQLRNLEERRIGLINAVLERLD